MTLRFDVILDYHKQQPWQVSWVVEPERAGHLLGGTIT